MVFTDGQFYRNFIRLTLKELEVMFPLPSIRLHQNVRQVKTVLNHFDNLTPILSPRLDCCLLHLMYQQSYSDICYMLPVGSDW